MLKTIIEIWPVMAALAVILMGLGRALWILDDLVKWKHGIDERLMGFQTTSMCDRCRIECEKRNNEHFKEIKTLLSDIYDKRDDYVAALGDVSCRLGRIEGKLTNGR